MMNASRLPVIGFTLAILAFQCGSAQFGSKIVRHPEDLTVLEGDNARFTCRVANLPFNHTIEWSVDEIHFGPWIPGYSQLSYFFPEDCDISLDEYDLEIASVKWSEHAGSQFSCHITAERKASNKATLTVLVPPTRLIIVPVLQSGMIRVSPSAEAENVTCATDFATPGSKIAWTVDGKLFPGLDTLTKKRNNRGGELTKLSSLITLFSSTNISAKSSSGEGYSFKEENMMEMVEHRINVDGLYRRAFHVVCQLTNPVLKSKVLSESVWVVFDGRAGNAAQTKLFSGFFLWILIGAGVVFVLAVITIGVGCRKLRKLGDQRRNAVLTPKIEVDAGFVIDVCSSADSDKTSDASTLRPWPVNSEHHPSHVAYAGGDGSHGAPHSTGHYARGDCAAVVQGSTCRSSYPPSIRSDSSAHAMYDKRNETVRFLTRPPPQHSPNRLQESVQVVSTSGSDVYAHNFVRHQFGTLTVPDRRNRTSDEARGVFGKPMTTFGSLPRGDLIQRQRSAPAPEVSSDLPPPPSPPRPGTPPPAQGAPDFPSPMSMLDYLPRYNLVSQRVGFKPTHKFGRSDAEGMSDPSPTSLSPGPNFPAAGNPAGFLV